MMIDDRCRNGELRQMLIHLEDCQEGSKLNLLSCSSHQPCLKLCHLDKQVDPHLSEQQKIIKSPKGRHPKKKRDFLGIFPKCRTPPSPPFGNPCFPKKKCGLFCILGHLEHFWSSQKCSLFGNYSNIYFWE